MVFAKAISIIPEVLEHGFTDQNYIQVKLRFDKKKKEESDNYLIPF